MQQFADFLGGQAPFDALDADDLVRLASHVEVEFFAAGAVLVPQDAPRLDHLWVVRTGALEVVDRDRVVDLLGPGDTFGHVPLMSGSPPRFGLRAAEDSLCLRIPDPRAFLAQPQRLRFTAVETVSRRDRLVRDIAGSGPDRRLAQLMRPAIWARATDRVRDVAARISAAGNSCALVRTGTGLGIVTDHDFRRRVATGELAPDAPVAELATVPALTVDEDATQAAGLLQMVEHGVHHLVVTDQSDRPVGVVRVVDLARADVRDPLLIRSAIEAATTLDELAEASRSLPATIVELRDNGTAAPHIGAVQAAVVDAVVRRALALRRDDALTAVAHSWVLLGSLARREPLPMSDLDTALVWADPQTPGTGPDDAIRRAAAAVLDDLERCGLDPCANGANASNPLFSRSRSGWIGAARAWQHDPTMDGALLLSAMVADSRPITGVPLGRSLTEMIRAHTRTTQFLRAMLSEALGWRPPTGFVRDFVVQQSGERRGQLDLKAGGLAPVVALARWVAIVTGDARGTTPERLHRGAERGLLRADEARTLAGAFEDIYSLLLDHQVGALRDGGTSTTYIAPKTLDTLTRRHLRESFRAVAAVQSRIDQDWLIRLDGMTPGP